MTETNVPLAGVVGSPIAHSKSPALHAHWLKVNGIAGYYVPIELKPQDFETGIRALPKLGFEGVNVTIPYKETALALADVVTDRAALIGAANTLTFRSGGKIQADNTDGYGFIANLRQCAPDWQAKTGPALVLGAGGAARAVVSSLLDDGAPQVIVANRSRPRAEMLIAQFGAKVTVVDWAATEQAIDGATTIVNTTSLGMTGNPPLSVSLDRVAKTALVTDLVYTPLQTPFLKAATARGLTVVDGLGMLLHQGAPAFEKWFRARPTVDDATRQAVLQA